MSVICRGCGANCDPADIRQGLCEECWSAEPEVRITSMGTDRKRQKVLEEMERSWLEWGHFTN